MTRPPVTPIFPRNNGLTNHNNIQKNLPIMHAAPREHVLAAGGFSGSFNPEIAHSVHHGHVPPFNNQPVQHVQQPLNCITIAQHIDNCPICSRLYDTDKTLYILAIIGLLILCFLMAKHISKI